MNIITITLLIASVITGIIIVEILKPKKSKNIQILLTFSGAYLLAVSTLHLLPELFQNNTNKYIGLYILAGFLIQIILEYFSQGIEHGHFHKKKIISFSVLISLCLHSLLEGIPLGGHLHNHAHNALLTGIVLHKVPVSIVLMTFFQQSNIKKYKSYLYLLLFALMSPIGVFTGDLFSNIANFYEEIMAIVIGIFLHISTTILFESSDGHRFSLLKILAIILGACITIISL